MQLAISLIVGEPFVKSITTKIMTRNKNVNHFAIQGKKPEPKCYGMLPCIKYYTKTSPNFLHLYQQTPTAIMNSYLLPKSAHCINIFGMIDII